MGAGESRAEEELSAEVTSSAARMALCVFQRFSGFSRDVAVVVIITVMMNIIIRRMITIHVSQRTRERHR
jgi:hypothetical protein